jgi:hypothetical protein
MDAATLRKPYVLLTKLFLRQFLENDLVNPEADRSQLLAIVGAITVCLTLFVSFFMSSAYVGAFLTPRHAAIQSLDDKFFYLALAMIATALVAASQWDVLAIDPRDAAILEPLPVPAGTIRRAKLTAVAVLGGAVAVGVNVFPSVVFPWLLVLSFRLMSGWALLALVVTHFVATVAAAAFGYLFVIALRESLAATLGRRGFTLVSPWVQGVLIVLLGSALLLLPSAANRIGQRGFDGWRAQSPPMWFLGAYELVAGDLVANVPYEAPEKMSERARRRRETAESSSSTLYDERRPQFLPLARRAGIALVLALLVAAGAYLWNGRRLPSLSPAPPPAARARWKLGARLVNAILARDGTVRAGFHFTLAAMWRSNTHRLTLACAAAAGFAMSLVALSNANVEQGAGPSTRLLIMQPLLYGALLVGFRHIIRVPAELRASWGFQLAWRGRERPFVAGVKRAAIVALVLPALAIFLPLFAFVMGWPAAAMHAGLGLAGAVVLLEALMVSYDKVPFTCTYLPSENMKALGPIYALAFIIGASAFARMQLSALVSGDATRVLLVLAVVFAACRLMSVKRHRLPQVEFDEAPVTYQQLGLHR